MTLLLINRESVGLSLDVLECEKWSAFMGAFIAELL